MKAVVTIEKTFDDGKKLTKEWESGDFHEFFVEEGDYLDRLSKIVEDKGDEGDSFTVTYSVTVTK